jgi:hypothetical protein
MTRRTIREGLAAIGVIVSLIFVGTEIRQNTIAIQGATRNELASSARDMLMVIASNPELASVWRRWLAGEALSPDEQIMAWNTATAYLRGLENVFLQVEAGSVDETALVGYGLGAAAGVARSPHFLAYWEMSRGGFHPDFVSAFEAKVLVPR